MRFDSRILGLPASLILFLTSHTSAAVEDERSPKQWVNERSSPAKPWPQDPRRSQFDSNEQKILRRTPIGVLKMSDDPGEKFYMHYWQFEEDSAQSTIPEVPISPPLRARDEEEEALLLSNSSVVIPYRAPFALHTDDESSFQELRARGRVSVPNAAAALAALQKRAFTCPTGTSDCSIIGSPNACCAIGETCFNITDTGLGSVGCCPNGVSCGGTVTTCDSGNTPCAKGGEENANYEHGGCCIPNYVCAGVGCVINPTLVVTVVVTQTFTGFPSTVQTSTALSTITPSTSSQTDTALQTTLECSSGAHACPVNLGGGCCASGFTCAPSSSCVPPSGFTFPSVSTTSGTGVGAIRPTTDSSTPVTTPVDTGSCPTGFYACSAFYRGGCCRTGRDCQTTSCPPTSSTTIVSGTETIVVPVGSAAALATPSGVCATGWSTCAPSVGGNCCPSGWECGTASCSSINPSQTNVLQKASPNGGTRNMGLRTMICAFAGVLIGAFITI